MIGSQAVPVPIDRAAADPRARLRPGAQGPDGRARVLLPGHDQPLRRAARRRPRRPQAAALASTPRAGSSCASSRRPAALPATFTGIKVAAAVAVIGAGVRRVGGLGPRARPHAADRQRAARDRRARSPPPCCCSRCRSPCTALFALLERRVVDWTPGPSRGDHDTLIAALLLIAASRSRAAARSRSPAATPTASTEPLRLVLDYFPNADHAGIYAAQATGRVPQGRPRRGHQGAAGPGRAAEAAAGGPRRRRRSPTSPSCCWRATRAPTTSSRSARSCRSR